MSERVIPLVDERLASLAAKVPAQLVSPTGLLTDARGRPPFGKETPVLVFARPLSGGARPEVQALQLVSADAQVPWSAQAEADVRAILQAARQPGAAGLMVRWYSFAVRPWSNRSCAPQVVNLWKVRKYSSKSR